MEHPDVAWVASEFSSLDLGDERLEDRLRSMALDAAHSAHGRISAVFRGAKREAAYRFVENPRVEPAAIIEACAHAAMQRLNDGDDVVIVVLDQSALSLKDPDNVRGLGRVGTSKGKKIKRGVQVMTALALDSAGHVLGLVAQEWFLRDEAPSPKWAKDKRPLWERETSLWIHAMSTSTMSIRKSRPDAKIVFMADRGGDHYMLFNAAKALRVDVIVRSAYDRKLVGGGNLHAKVMRSPVLAKVQREVRFTVDEVEKRALVPMSIRAVRVTLELRTSTQAKRGTADVSIVHLKSTRQRQPISWFIITTRPVTTTADATRIIDAYCCRWRIEDFHRTWKRGGCNVEATQLRSLAAIKCWATTLAAVAARTERLRTLSRTEPERPAKDELSDDELLALKLISSDLKTWHPKDWEHPTLIEVTTLIAYNGGWGGGAKKRFGSVTLGRGLGRVVAAAAVVAAMRMERSG